MEYFSYTEVHLSSAEALHTVGRLVLCQLPNKISVIITSSGLPTKCALCICYIYFV